MNTNHTIDELEKTSLLYLIVNNHFDVIHANQTALKFYKWKDYLNKNLVALCKEHKLTTSINKMSIDLALNASPGFVDHIRFANGELKVILWNSYRIDTTKIGMVGTDITALKLAEADKNNLSIYLENIIDNVPHFIFWKDKNSTFLGCNKAFAASAGLSRSSEIIGKTDYDLPWGKFEADNYRKDDLEVMSARVEKLNIEESQTTPDGRQITLLTSKVPLLNAFGEIVGVLGIYSDITHIKDTELALKNALTQTVAASKAKSEFIANMSHDIRTPITGILGLSHSFFDNATTTETKNDAKALINATNELLRLLNEIIDVVGLESGQIKNKEEDFSLRALISHNIDLLTPAITHKKLTLSSTIDEKIPDYLYGNRRNLDRILLNLLSNAVKFTNTGAISLRITKISKKNNKLKLKFCIQDTGIGIPENKQKMIFQNFSRLNSSYQGIYKGSGLGLYTVKQYLRAMRGRITVTSEEGKGSIFCVTVPMLISNDPPPAPKPSYFSEMMAVSRQTLTKQSVAKNENSKITILAVEDNALAARMLQQTLEKLNCNTQIATSGKEAVQMVNIQDYDLVLMDIGLPDIDGFEATKRIRHLDDKFKAHVPIIALTAHISEPMKKQCQDVGMQDMLTKPVTLLTMQQTLIKYLNADVILQNHMPENKNTQNTLLTIDLENSANIGGNDINFAKKMLAMLAETLPRDLAQINQTYLQKDLTALNKLIHKMDGGLSYCGVPKLRQITQNLQIAISQKNVDKIDTLIKDLFEEGEEVLRVWHSLKDV